MNKNFLIEIEFIAKQEIVEWFDEFYVIWIAEGIAEGKKDKIILFFKAELKNAL